MCLVTLAMQFARKASYAPTPQPGKYPIVFPAGAGEPTKDSFMALDGFSLFRCFAEMPDNFSNSERFAEFSMNATYEGHTFRKELTVANLLCLAQRIVHSHQNMGLPMGDFSAVSSTETFTMRSAMAVIEQFGEFSESYLGTRYLFKDYSSEVTALVRTAKAISDCNGAEGYIAAHLLSHWLPCRVNDKRTAFIVANKIRGYFQERGITLKLDDLCSGVFNEKFPAFNAALSVLPEDDQEQFDILFTGYNNQQEFRAKFFGTNSHHEVLDTLGLPWPQEISNALNWNVIPKMVFPDLAETWLRKKPTIAKYFLIENGLVQKSEAMGSAGQLSSVDHANGVTLVKSKVALSAPQFSMISAFPPCGLFEDCEEYRVVLPTSIHVNTRAIEFQLNDWKS